MPEFVVKYEITEPVGYNRNSGYFRYEGDGTGYKRLKITADNEADARKKAAKHPTLLENKKRTLGRINFDVQDRGGKARHKIKSVTRVSGGGGGAMLDLGRMATGTDLPPKRKMKGGGAVMSGRGGSFKGVR